MKIDLQKLAHILAVAELRNFSRAAQKLNISQPALSRSIAVTERRFGVTIFERGRGGVSVTHQGAAIIKEATALMHRAKDLEHNLLLYGRGEGGRVRFGMAPLIASIMLSRLGLKLLRERAGMSAHIDIKPPTDLIEDVRTDAIEMAIVPVFSVQDHDDLSIETLGNLDLSVLVRSGHPLTHMPEIAMADLWRYPVACGSEIDMPLKNSGIFICSNFHIVREMVLESDLVWFSSGFMLDVEMTDSGLERLSLMDFPQAEMDAVIIHRRYRRASPAMAYLINAVSQEFPRPAAG